MMFGLLLVLTFIASLLFLVGSIVFWSIRNGITPMPSSRKAKEAILDCIAKEKPGNIHELGSGWGTLIIPLAKENPDTLVVGYETSPIPYYVSLIRARINGAQNLLIQRKDFYQVPLNDAACVVCYLFPSAMVKLKGKLEKELKKGTTVISNTFALSGWTPEQIVEIKDLYHTKIYLYRL